MTDKKEKKTSVEIVQYIKSIKEVNDVSPERFVLPDCETIDPNKMEKEFEALLKGLIGD